jgi:hypothetical protein
VISEVFEYLGIGCVKGYMLGLIHCKPVISLEDFAPMVNGTFDKLGPFHIQKIERSCPALLPILGHGGSIFPL